MDATAIIKELRDAGLHLRLGDAQTIKVTPAAQITPALRTLIQDHKPALLLALAAAPTDDSRVTCSACRHLQQGQRCRTPRRAGLASADLAPEFTHLRQHCPGFAPR